MIEFRYCSTTDHDFRTAADRPQTSINSVSSRLSAKNIQVAFIFAIFWSEERQRMRLKLYNFIANSLSNKLPSSLLLKLLIMKVYIFENDGDQLLYLYAIFHANSIQKPKF